MASFPHNRQTTTMVECRANVVEPWGNYLAGFMAGVGPKIGAYEAWGTPSMGRIVAPLPGRQLMSICEAVVTKALSTSMVGGN